ncbi:YheC/YheD family endospore coat-associated protein [Bacillus massiliglaciei]|uniref:YheC/YheD family endospore coat-associated protein n=1 Tax=Bacillus massiliglaciei TaxID=1816693 RepID=UPI000AD45B69|nr:YheC/YheD family protein [Bacillus massiliglaciei]
MKKFYEAEIAKIPGHICFYPSEMKNVGEIDLINFGQHSCTAIVKRNPSVQQNIVLSEDLAQALHFNENNTPLHLFVHERRLHLGPLVGIFSSGFTGIENKPVGERSGFFANLLALKKTTGCIPYLFGEQHINWEDETIRGHVFLDGKWAIETFPFPNAVYDRLPNRKTENKDAMQEIKRKFQKDYVIPWYNPGFFNKWDVHERLAADPGAKPFLPETRPFDSFSSIETMLSEYRQVYIKPINGSLGLGIHQIVYDSKEHWYYCRYKNEKNENKLQRFPSLESLMNHVFKGSPLDNFIVQQGIPLLKYEKRSVDFRVHTNKDSDGNWQISAIAAKVAGPGSVTTHVKNGGTIKTLAELFPAEEEAQLAEKKLSEAALILSKSLEERMEGIIAEIGFDLALDKDQHVWMFEANSKPGRSIFSHPKLKEFEALTRKLSIGYAIYLTEQSIAGTAGASR